MSQPKPYVEIEIDKNANFKDTLNALDDSDNGCFVNVDIKYPDEVKHKTKTFPICPLNNFSPKDKFSKFSKHKQKKNLIFVLKKRKQYVIGLTKKSI